MRFLFICMLTVIAATGPACPASAQEAKSEKGGDLGQLLTAYLQKRLEEAQLTFESLTRQKDEGVATLPQVLAAEDEIDRWKLHLRLATEGRLISNHPILNEIRREFGVPEIPHSADVRKSKAVSSAIQEYLQKRLEGAERLLGSATLLHKMGRATESEVLAARSRVDGLKLLLEVERHKSPARKE